MPKVNINGTHLFFDVYGSKLKITDTKVIEKPTLLMLHGAHGLVDHTLYVDFWSKFSDIAQVIFLDQRGVGRSDKVDSSQWNLKHWGQDVYDFCQALDIQKPIVAGVSMGGHVMCEYVSKFPDHPGALIFCHTEAKHNVDAIAAMFKKLGGEDIEDIYRKSMLEPTPENAKRYQEKCMPLFGKVGYQKAQTDRCIKNPEIFAHYCADEMKTFDYLTEMAKIHCPTLFMVGEQSPGHPPELAEEMVAHVDPKWVAYHEFKDAGAPVYNDLPDEAYKVVKGFLESVNV